MDILFVISDNSARAIRSAGRVNDLVRNIRTRIKKICLVVTKASAEDMENLRTEIEKTGLELAGVIPADRAVAEYDILGKPLFGLPNDSTAVRAVYDILERMKI